MVSGVSPKRRSCGVLRQAKLRRARCVQIRATYSSAKHQNLNGMSTSVIKWTMAALRAPPRWGSVQATAIKKPIFQYALNIRNESRSWGPDLYIRNFFAPNLPPFLQFVVCWTKGHLLIHRRFPQKVISRQHLGLLYQLSSCTIYIYISLSILT